MKVKELEGDLLNLWVARAEGLPKNRSNWVDYCNRWAVGGPIIEREKIACHYNPYAKAWIARYFDGNMFTGASMLIAALRCYLASRYGEDIDDSQAHND